MAFFLTPKASETISISSGDIQRYEMELYTTHEHISHIKITSFNKVEGNIVLTDTLLNEKIEKFIFDYRVPFFNRDAVSVTLTFEAWDDAGSYGMAERQLIVKNNSYFIGDLNNIVLHTHTSGYPDAFSFGKPSQTFNWKTSPDSLQADIYLTSNTDFSMLGFGSNTNAKMVRINNFDYPSATPFGVQTVFESSRRSNIIDQLQINDIILVGHDSQAEGVLYITNIIRQGTPAEQCVQLSFKAIERTIVKNDTIASQ